MLNKKISTLMLMGSTVALMGIAMPSCPGQQAIQQQIDALQTKDAANTKRMQGIETQVKGLSDELAQSKQLLTQLSQTVIAQRTAIEQLEASVKNMASHPSSGSKSSAKSSGKSSSKSKASGKKHH